MSAPDTTGHGRPPLSDGAERVQAVDGLRPPSERASHGREVGSRLSPSPSIPASPLSSRTGTSGYHAIVRFNVNPPATPLTLTSHPRSSMAFADMPYDIYASRHRQRKSIASRESPPKRHMRARSGRIIRVARQVSSGGDGNATIFTAPRSDVLPHDAPSSSAVGASEADARDSACAQPDDNACRATVASLSPISGLWAADAVASPVVERAARRHMPALSSSSRSSDQSGGSSLTAGSSGSLVVARMVSETLQRMEGRDRKREKFYDNLISLRRKKTVDSFDLRHVGFLIPCYNEGNDIMQSACSIVDEVPHFAAKCPEIHKITAMFIVDGSGVAQLETSVAVLQCFVEVIQSAASLRPFIEKRNTAALLAELEQAKRFFHALCDDEREIEKMKGFLTKEHSRLGATSAERRIRELFIAAYAERKAQLFGDKVVNGQYPDYPTQLFQFAFDIPFLVDAKSGSKRAKRHMFLQCILLVKENNRMKRDSILLGFYRFLSFADVPFLTGFLDADTSFQHGAYAAMFNKMLNDADCVGTSGFLRVRNASMFSPLCCIQDFSWLVSQTFQKEAENLLGAVTCLPGACSAGQTLALTVPLVLDQIATRPVTLAQRNMVELGEDRFVTTMLLTDSTVSRKPRIVHLSGSVSYSDAPADIVSFMLQQRRWINSTLCNSVVGLLPFFFSHLSSSVAWTSPRMLLLTLWLILRTVFEALLFFVSPGIVGMFAVAVLRETVGGATVPLWSVAAFFATAVFLTLLFPNPRHFRFFYRWFFMLFGTAAFGFVVWWLYVVVRDLVGGTSQYYPKTTYDYLRLSFLCMLAFSSLVLAVLHGKGVQYFSPPWKPLLFLGFCFPFFMLIPIFSLYNLSSLGWGNKACEMESSYEQVRSADRITRYFFVFFLLCNLGILYLACLVESAAVQYYFVLCVLGLACASLAISFVLSALSAIVRLGRAIVPEQRPVWRERLARIVFHLSCEKPPEEIGWVEVDAEN